LGKNAHMLRNKKEKLPWINKIIQTLNKYAQAQHFVLIAII
jgi:hypothetical protein